MTWAVELVRVSKSFPGAQALMDVDLTLRAGSIHALIGENGAGKSTLINILSGVFPPDHGTIRLAGQTVQFAGARSAHRQGIVTVHQEVDLFPDLTVAENLGLEQGLTANQFGWIDWSVQRRKVRDALKIIGEDLPLGAPASALSPAQRQLLLIAAAISQAARVLILDEPTSSLSHAEAQRLFRHLRRFRDAGTAILYVSHRLEEIFQLADEITILRDGRRVSSSPIPDTTAPDLIRQMVGREMACVPRNAKALGPMRFSSERLTSADGSFTDVSLTVHGGEVLGLYGLIGAGRSEWAQSVFGLAPYSAGTLSIDAQQVTVHSPAEALRSGLAYVPEDRLRQGLCRGLTIRANVVLATLGRLASRLWLTRAAELPAARAAIERLAIRARSPEQDVGTLSGGNQQKVVLARWLGTEPKVLLLDEPTRGVDVGAKAEIHALIHRLAAEGRAIVLISSDLPEVLAQSDRVGVFRAGRLVGFFDPKSTPAEEIAVAAYASAGGGSNGLPEVQRAKTVGRRLPLRTFSLLRECALVLILFGLFGLLQWRTGRFFEPANLHNLATEASLLAFCAIGTSLVILAGALDISLGALMALSAGVAGRLWEDGSPLAVAVLAAVGVGAVGGFLNAGLALIGGIHPIVVTLGTMSVYRGLTLWWLGQDVNIPGEARNWLFDEAMGLPLLVWAGIALVLATWVLLRHAVVGRHLYALGGNPAAAHRIGIARWRIWLGAFTIQGICVGLAGLLYLARSGNLQHSSHEGETLRAIAAVVVGGVAITGGRGSVWGVALGCLFLGALPQATPLLGISPNWDTTLAGVIMVIAVVVDALWRRPA